METPSATAAAVAGPAGAVSAATAAASASSATAAVVATPAAATANAAGAATASASRGGRAKSSTTKKRHALPLGRPSSTRPSESGEMPPTPTDQMAPSSFAYETPSPSSSRSVRGVRARQNETAVQSPDDADSKGGRSLRRKPRIDYSFDHVEASETFAARVTPSAARSLKKRKTDISFHDGDADEEHELRVKRRASEQPLAAAGSSRRKAAARKNTVEPQMYVPEQHLEEAEVQDTIEVGGRHSMHSDDSFRARTSSGGSSHHDLTPKAGPPLSSISQPPPPPTSSIPPSSPSPPSPRQPVFPAQPVSVPTDAESGVVAVSSTHSPQQETNVLTSTAPASALNESAIEDDEPGPEPEPVEEPRPAKTPEPLEEPGPAQEQVQEPVKELDSIQPPQEGQVFTEPAPAESIAEPVVESAVKESTSEPEEKQSDPPLQVESEPPPQPKQEHEAESLPLPKPLPETPPETLPEALPETQPELKGTTPPPPTTSESQPDPKSPVKPSSPKASRTKASAVEIPAAKPIKEELKEKPVAKPTLVKNASIPAVTVSKPAEPRTRKQSVNDPLGHLTPYVDGAFVWLPKLKANGEADADGEPEAEADQDAPADGDADATLDDADEPVEGADEETPIGTPLAPETAANSPAPELELASMLPSKRQFAFRKTREAAEFTALFDDVKSLSYTDLYYRLEVANRALQAWQNEFNKLRLVTEDEDNSMRYHQEEAAFRQREKMALSKDPSANPLRKDYIVKGLRASKPDAHLAYMRQQDKVMAQAYGFDYDDRESKIGQQDPHAQRTGAAGKARLRDRPKQTAKAAESDDPAVISGKRARKAPTLFDGLESVSRSSTPAPTSQPKGRRRRGAGQGGDEINDLQSSPPEANSEVVPTRKGKGGRPRKYPLPATQTDVTSAPAVDDGPTLPTPNILERPARKRRRRDLDEEDEALANGTASEASKKAKRRNSRLSEVPTGSFYSQSSTYADEDNRPATASSTASNTTADSSPNNYSLREKRQKKFSLDDGEYDDVGGAEDDDGATANHSRPAKRARRGPRKTYFEPVMPLPDEYMADVPQSEQSQAQAPKPTPKIKIKNYQPSGASPAAAAAIPTPLPPLTTSVPASSPYSPAPSQTMDSPTTQTGSFHSNGHTPQTEPELEKDYSTMTKSEKMSYSMKARWASGSMSAAVSKRRATLAAKKSARAATPPKPSAAVAVTPGATEPPTGDAHPPAVAK